jgi:predicted Mrr-cat superfamily restriction endonuclease
MSPATINVEDEQLGDNPQAFVLRITTGDRQDRVPGAIKDGDIIIGWSQAGEDLLKPDLDWKSFRQIVHNEYCQSEADYRRSGRYVGGLWPFIRQMKCGDLVVVPHGNTFYVVKVIGPARYEKQHRCDDTAFRRQVEWLAGPIRRSYAHAPLQSRMKVRNACVKATDLLPQIREAIEVFKAGSTPTFGSDLRNALISETKKQFLAGRIDNYGFEKLVESVLVSLGVKHLKIVPRRQDKGGDLLGIFDIGGICELRLAVQAKQYRPSPPTGKEAIDELIRGMEAEGADFGFVCEDEEKRTGFRLELVDGEQLAAMIVDGGLTSMGLD